MGKKETSLKFNERKAQILQLLVKATRRLTRNDIAMLCGITKNNASSSLKWLYHRDHGYIERKKINGKQFSYQFLKPKGDRACKELWIRLKLREMVCDQSIPLDLREQIPDEYKKYRTELDQKYNIWRFGE